MTIADQITDLLAGFREVEFKVRHVRDADFWGAPVGTPIVPGVKPRQLPIPGVPPPPPDLPTSRSRRGGRWERDPDLLTALVGEGADPGMGDVFRNYNGDLVVFEKGVVADDAVKFATIEDVDFALDHLPDEVGPVSVVFPAYDPMFQDADVSVPPDLLPPNLTLGYVMRGPLTIHLNPTMLKEMYPHIEGRSQEQGVPALSRMSLRRSVIMHESGHIMENYQGNVVASMGRERAIAANDAISRGGMSAYGMTSPQEAYAEAWAQWTLGDGSDGVYDETARGLAEVFGWPDPPNRSRAVIRPGTRKSIQDLLDTLQDKVRHVRDADYWGAPPGTPLPLPKKPKAPDPIEVLHRYQAQDIEAAIRDYDRQANSLRERIGSYRGRYDDGEGPGWDEMFPDIAAETRSRLETTLDLIARNKAILAGDEPYPDSTIEQVDDYIWSAELDARRRWSLEHPYTVDPQHPFQLWEAERDAFVEKDPDVVALRKVREITITHMPERFGGKPVSSQDALLYSPDEYYDVLKRVLPDEARQELPDQDAAVVFKKASQALLAERMDHEATTSLVKEVTRLRPGQIPMDLRQPGDSVDDILRRYALRQAVEQWAMSSGDSHAESIATQRIARDEFGLGTVYMPDPEPRYCTEDDIREELDKGTDGRRAFLRAQYDLTQQVLKDQGVEALLVMRGLTLTPEQKKHLPEPGERVTAVQQPLSSWAVGDSDTAAQFGGTVVWTVVPREKVLSTPATGFGCLGENEVVVIADTLQVEVVSKR